MLLTFQLSEVVDCLSPQGQLPLGMALLNRSTSIAQTLVQNGKADVNAYNGEVSAKLHSFSLLHGMIRTSIKSYFQYYFRAVHC